MSKLFISSDKNISTSEIALMLAEEGFECQISKNISTIKNEDKFSYELGFCITFLDLDKKDFKEKVWEPLSKRLDLKCAHIEYLNKYKGCVLNWPGVFSKDNCIMSDTNN
tara:strand:- start:582 stop:911 length:330 start_codon:yes stop_codon:yes gene_type:complete